MVSDEITDSHLRISNVKGRPSYYCCSRDPKTNQRTEQYIRKSNLSLAASIAQQEYDHRSINQPEDGFETENGELVRSKSEKIIADKFFKHKIHYQYEKPLILFDGNHRIKLHPDFTLLKKGDFQEYYHEHFGMMDTPDYCRSAIRKISLYRKNGIFEGERLFITFESSLFSSEIQ